MRKMYLDRTGHGAVAVFIRDAEVIPAGTTVFSMSLRQRNEEYERWGREYGIYFIFDDMRIEIPFYAVPWVDIFAVDGQGGYFGSVGEGADLEGEGPVCFFKDGKCLLAAPNGPAFMRNAACWRQCLTEYGAVALYPTREQAARELDFISFGEADNPQMCIPPRQP